MNDIKWKYVKKLEDKKNVTDFETANRVRLPDDLKNCILENNGGRPSLRVFDSMAQKERVVKGLLSFNKSDLDNVYTVMEVFKKGGLGLIPFASDPFGNFICLDPNDKDSVVFWNHENGEAEQVCSSFSSFINSLYKP